MSAKFVTLLKGSGAGTRLKSSTACVLSSTTSAKSSAASVLLYTLFMGWDTGKLQTQDAITHADSTRGYEELKPNKK